MTAPGAAAAADLAWRTEWPAVAHLDDLWLAVLFHAGINTATYGAPLLLPALEREAIFTPVLGLTAAVLALAAAVSWRSGPSH